MNANTTTANTTTQFDLARRAPLAKSWVTQKGAYMALAKVVVQLSQGDFDVSTVPYIIMAQPDGRFSPAVLCLGELAPYAGEFARAGVTVL